MSKWWVKVGAKCRCIEAPWRIDNRGPVIGEDCEVTSIVEGRKGQIFLYLKGHDQVVVENELPRVRFAYNSICFRPLHSLEDDVAVHFSQLLDVKPPAEPEAPDDVPDRLPELIE